MATSTVGHVVEAIDDRATAPDGALDLVEFERVVSMARYAGRGRGIPSHHLRGGESPVTWLRYDGTRCNSIACGLSSSCVDSRYGAWLRTCAARGPARHRIVFHEGNSVRHRQEYEG